MVFLQTQAACLVRSGKTGLFRSLAHPVLVCKGLKRSRVKGLRVTFCRTLLWTGTRFLLVRVVTRACTLALTVAKFASTRVAACCISWKWKPVESVKLRLCRLTFLLVRVVGRVCVLVLTMGWRVPGLATARHLVGACARFRAVWLLVGRALFCQGLLCLIATFDGTVSTGFRHTRALLLLV